MRMRVLGGLAVAAAALAMPVGAIADNLITPNMPVQVGPRTIGTRTDVLVRFRQPMTTGSNGEERSIEALVISGPSRPQCIGSSRVVLAAARAGTTIHHLLRPRWLGGEWCTGTYDGRVTYQVQADCTVPGPVKAKDIACPMFIIAPRTLATFHFRVTAR